VSPLVLLHGWCGDHTSWPPLFRNRRVVAPDLTHDGGLYLPAEPSIVIGHSMGGTLARRVARASPDKVLALVFVDAHLPKFPPDPVRRQPFLQPFRENYQTAASQYIDSLGAPHAVKQKMLQTPAAAGLAALESLNSPDTCAWTGEPSDTVSIPVLALWANPSPMARVGPEHEQWMRQWCPNLRYETWPGASHFLHLEHPARFEALVDEFLAKHRL